MKAILTYLFIIYSFALYSQERITSIESKNIRDELHFFTSNNRNYFSSIDDLDTVSVYRINLDGSTNLVQRFQNTEYRESVIHEEYIMSKIGAARFHNMLTNQSYDMQDIIPEGELRWTRSVEGHAILQQDDNNTYVIDLDNISIAYQSQEHQKFYNKYKEHLIYIDKFTDERFCVENTIDSQSKCFEVYNGVKFTSNYFIYEYPSSLKYINLKELIKYDVLLDHSDVRYESSHEHLLLCTAILDEVTHIYLINMDNNSIYDLGVKEYSGNLTLINESEYVLKTNSELIFKDISSGATLNQIAYPIFASPQFYNNDFILPRGNFNEIINAKNNESISFDPPIRSIRSITEIDEGVILIYAQPKDEDGHLIFQFDSNNFTLDHWSKAPLNQYGIDFNYSSILKDESIYISEKNLYQVDNNNNVQQINQGQYFDNNSFIHQYNSTNYETATKNVWIDYVIDTIYLYQQIENQKELVNKIATNQIALQPPYDKLSAIQNEDQSFLLIDSSYKNTIVEIIDGEVINSLQYDYFSVDLIDYVNGFLYFGDNQLNALDSEFNVFTLDGIERSTLWGPSKLIKLEDKTLFAASNGLYQIDGSDYTKLVNTPNSHGLLVETEEHIYLHTSHSGVISYNKNTNQTTPILEDHIAIKYSYPFIFFKQDYTADITRAYNIANQSFININPSHNLLHDIKKNGEYYYLIYGDDYSSKERYLYRTDANLANAELLKEFKLNYPYGVKSYWNENFGLLIANRDMYICDDNFELREISEIAGYYDNNIIERDGNIYLMAIDPELGKQLFKISDLSSVMVGLKDYNIQTNTLHIYPNPAQEYIQLEGINEHASYSIYDINGKRIAHSTMKQSQISISQLSAGTYFIHVMDGETISVGKVVVVR